MLAKARRRKPDAGYTIVEFLVVVAVLGILAGVVVFSLSGAGNGQAAACATEKSGLEAAQAAYFAKNNAYAANEATLKMAGYLTTLPTWYVTDNAVAPYEVVKNPTVARNPCP